MKRNVASAFMLPDDLVKRFEQRPGILSPEGLQSGVGILGLTRRESVDLEAVAHGIPTMLTADPIAQFNKRAAFYLDHSARVDADHGVQ